MSVLEQLNDLISELESIVENIEDHGMLDGIKEELENQQRTISTILEDWVYE